jgi:START domain/Cytoskeletal-regulatory complex EF hand/Regulator of G protein signaling domain/WW domain
LRGGGHVWSFVWARADWFWLLLLLLFLFVFFQLNEWLQLLHMFVGNQWALNEAEVADFGLKFDRAAGPGEALLNGARAREIFSASGLPAEALGKIWALADRDRDKQLDKKEFTVAMALVRGKQKGWQLPSALPDPLVWSVWEEERGRVALIPPPSAGASSPALSYQPSSSHGLSDSRGASPQTYASRPSATASDDGGVQRTDSMKYGIMPNPEAQPKSSSSYGPMHIPANGGKGMLIPPPANAAGYSDSVPYGTPIAVDSADPTRAPTSGLAPASGLAPPGGFAATAGGAAGIQPSPKKATGRPAYGGIPASKLSASAGGATPASSPGKSEGRDLIGASASAPGGLESITATRWVECAAPDGKVFYYDEISKKTTWDKPNEMQETEADDSSSGHRRKLSMATVDSLGLHLPLDSAVNVATDVASDMVLDAIMDPEKVAFLRTFLSEEGDNTELLFYTDCLTWRSNLPANQLPLPSDVTKAEAIFKAYLSAKKSGADHTLTSSGAVAGSNHGVTVSSGVKNAIKKSLRKASLEAKNTEALPSGLFDDAMREVLTTMQNEQFPKFMKSMVYLTMYNSLAARSAYELPEELWTEFVLACDGGDEEGWHPEGNMKGIMVETKSYLGDPLVYVRATGVIPLPPEDAYKFAVSTDLRALWDLNMTEARVLQRLDDSTIIFYIKYRPPKWASFMNNHDFVVLRTERRLPDGTILVLSRSVVHSDAPERKGHNRGEMHCGGFCIRPSGANKSTVIYVNQVHMHGIPKFAEKKYTLKRAMILKKIRSFVEKSLKAEKKSGKPPMWKNPQLDVNRSVSGRQRQASRSGPNSKPNSRHGSVNLG